MQSDTVNAFLEGELWQNNDTGKEQCYDGCASFK